MHTLRPYQSAAVNAAYAHFQARDGNPCVVLPTGAGKSHVIAQVCIDAIGWKSRVLVLAHRAELLIQNRQKIIDAVPELEKDVGLYCAGLNSRDTEQPVLVASIQSVYRRAKEIGPFDLVVVDEAHRISPKGETMYQQLLTELAEQTPALRVLGLTATPYRMKEGEICGPDNILNHVCCDVGVRELIRDGYLCPIVSKGGRVKADTSQLHIRAGEYVPAEMEALMSEENIVEAACLDIIKHTKGRKACLIFSSGVAHGRLLADTLYRQLDTDESPFYVVPRIATIFGDTPTEERAEILTAFREGRIPYLVNCQVLTEGFDAPNIDTIAMVRPTKSPGLMVQCFGRGLRTAPGKDRCVILDFGNNIEEHGPIDNLRIKKRGGDGSGEAPVRECPECHTFVPAGASSCSECGHVFPKRELKHTAFASGAAVVEAKPKTHEVRNTTYHIHHKVGDPDAPTTLRVEYEIGWNSYAREWVCFNHGGYARSKAVAWWCLRSRAPVPESTEAALTMALDGALAETLSITVKQDGKWERVMHAEVGPMPPWREPGEDDEDRPQGLGEMIDADECPF